MFQQIQVTPAKPEAYELAKAVLRLVRAEAELTDARDRVPDYTGQWSPADYYEDQQEEYNRAADALHGLIHPNPPNR